MFKVTYFDREMWGNIFLVLACFLAVFFFPTDGLLQKFISVVAFLVVAPLLYAKFILRKNLAELGFQWGNWREGVGGMLLAFLFSAPMLYILINYTDLLQKQGPLKIVQGRFWDFLYYEAVFSLALIVLFEIFLRGFVLLGAGKRMGLFSIGVQFVLAVLLVWSLDLFSFGIAYYLILGSFFSGIIAYRSRSLIFGLAFNALFVVVADAVVIKLLK